MLLCNQGAMPATKSFIINHFLFSHQSKVTFFIILSYLLSSWSQNTSDLFFSVRSTGQDFGQALSHLEDWLAAPRHLGLDPVRLSGAVAAAQAALQVANAKVWEGWPSKSWKNAGLHMARLSEHDLRST